LTCRRCQASLDAIFAFVGHENESLFTGTDTKKILEQEWESNLDNELYLCKILPGYKYDELTYITSLPLERALYNFKKTIQEPLELVKFSDPKFRTKTSGGGKGIRYTQAYIYPIDKRYKTKISIRSRIR